LCGGSHREPGRHRRHGRWNRRAQRGGVAVSGNDVLVTDGVFTGGRLLRLRG
jgi:hypothetical protein